MLLQQKRKFWCTENKYIQREIKKCNIFSKMLQILIIPFVQRDSRFTSIYLNERRIDINHSNLLLSFVTIITRVLLGISLVFRSIGLLWFVDSETSFRFSVDKITDAFSFSLSFYLKIGGNLSWQGKFGFYIVPEVEENYSFDGPIKVSRFMIVQTASI